MNKFPFDRHGWSLAELLVSITVLALILVMVAQALSVTQQTWLFAHASHEMVRIAEASQSTLVRHIRRATLDPRLQYDNSTGAIITDSDLHLVLGPSTELLPELPGAIGDAIFFLHPGSEGWLQSVLKGCGFFVEYADDSAWRPSFLNSIPSRRRFRLMHFHQPSDELIVFRHPALNTFTNRNELYSWFSQPVYNSDAKNISVVAENVIAMTIKAEAGEGLCYDTRRFQWEGPSSAANAMRHRLPQTIDVSLLLTDEASWRKLTPAAADRLAATLKRISQKQIEIEASQQPTFASLQKAMEAHKMRTRIVSLAIPLCDSVPQTK